MTWMGPEVIASLGAFATLAVTLITLATARRVRQDTTQIKVNSNGRLDALLDNVQEYREFLIREGYDPDKLEPKNRIVSRLDNGWTD